MTCTSFFQEWAMVGLKDPTGLGRQARDVRKVLGLGYHFVVPSERIEGIPPEGEREFWFKPDAPESEIEALFKKVKGIIFIERIQWHSRLMDVALRVGIKTVCIVNWEWFKADSELWKQISLILCPTQFSLKIVSEYGFDNAAYLPCPVDMSQFEKRSIKGPARFFVHNAGLVDHDDRKGTRDTILAFKRVKRRDLRLLVRMQKG